MLHNTPVLFGTILSYLSLSLLLGVVGNGFVFVSSIQYNAIRMDSSSVLVIQQLAVADILCCLLLIVPNFVNLIGGGLTLPHTLCKFTGYFTLTPCQAAVYFVLLLSINKLVYCSYPLRAGLIMSRRRVAGLSIVIWLVSILVSSVSIYTTKRDIIFDPDLYRCLYDRTVQSAPRILLVIVFTVLPLTVILILNITMCSIAVAHNRTRGQRSIKAPLTVACISAVLLLTVAPFVVYCLMTAVYTVTDSDREQWKQLKIFSGYIFYINVFSNPIIYTMTNTRFFNFVKYKILPCWMSSDFNDRVALGMAMGARKNSSFYLKSRNLSVSYKV